MLDSYRHFLLVVEHGTFTEAAHHAHLTQPALSASIARLEENLGAQVFHRGRRGAELSAAGSALLPHVRAALAAIEDGRRAVASVLGVEAGQLQIAAGATACTYLLPRVLAKFRARHPAIRFSLFEMTTEESLAAIRSGKVDMAVVGRGLRRSDPLPPEESERWLVERLVLVASPKYDVARQEYLTFRKGATTRALFERAFGDKRIVMELGSIAAIKGHARAGIGMALISENAVVDDLRRGKLVEVRDRRVPIRRELRLVHRGLERLHPAAAVLRDQLLDGRRNRGKKER